MADESGWTEFQEDRTSGWRSTRAGMPLEVWASYDEPTQFRVSVNKVLQPDFYPNREAACAAAEALAIAGGPTTDPS